MPNSGGAVSPSGPPGQEGSQQCGCCPQWPGVTLTGNQGVGSPAVAGGGAGPGAGGASGAGGGTGGGYGANDGRLQLQAPITPAPSVDVELASTDQVLDPMESTAAAWFSGVIDGGGAGTKANSPPSVEGVNSLCLNYGAPGPPFFNDQVALNMGPPQDWSGFIGLTAAVLASFGGASVQLQLQGPGGASSVAGGGAIPNGSFGSYFFDFTNLTTIAGSGVSLNAVVQVIFALQNVQQMQSVCIDNLVLIGPNYGPALSLPFGAIIQAPGQTIERDESLAFPDGDASIRVTYKSPDGVQGAMALLLITFPNGPLDVREMDGLGLYFADSGDAVSVDAAGQIATRYNPGAVEAIEWETGVQPQPRGGDYHGQFGLILGLAEIDYVHEIQIQVRSDNPDPTINLLGMASFEWEPSLGDRVLTELILIEESTIAKDPGADYASWSSSTVLGAAAAGITIAEEPSALEGASAIEVDGTPTTVNDWVQAERSYAGDEIDISSADLIQVWVYVDGPALGATPGGEVFFGLNFKDGATAFTWDAIRLTEQGWHLLQFDVSAAAGVASVDRVVVGMRGGAGAALPFRVDTIRTATLYDPVDRTKQLLNLE